VTGDFSAFDDDAARLGAELMARQRNGLGKSTAVNARDLARMTLVELHKQSAIALMDAALAHQGAGENTVSQNPLLMNIFINKPADQPLVNISMRLGTKLVSPWRIRRHTLSAYCRFA
jgi:hypothetical protein